jgi:prepilin-type N-terminal cleavage/methylation domain-containing protein
MKRQAGFTMVELMITMVVFVLTIAAASQIFTRLLTQFKQQSKIAETSIEGVVGLDMLRQDIEHAGLGMPWNVTGVAGWGAVPGYTEAADPDYTAYNDAPNEPSAFRSGDGAGLDVPGSDYLVIKSASASTDIAAGKNTLLTSAAPFVRNWALNTEDLLDTDRVIVLSPGSTTTNSRSLVVAGGAYYTQYSTVKIASSYTPVDNSDVRLVYGISANNLRAPFNRTDYYISINNVPQGCAAGTGVLVKATLDHATGNFNEMPILDCVADMQVIYSMDNNENGSFQNGMAGDAYTNTLAGLTPIQVRTRVKEVHVYILAHEGQRDTNFVFNNFTAGACGTCVRVGMSVLNDFNLAAINNYPDYRWKVYTISVKTENLS